MKMIEKVMVMVVLLMSFAVAACDPNEPQKPPSNDGGENNRPIDEFDPADRR